MQKHRQFLIPVLQLLRRSLIVNWWWIALIQWKEHCNKTMLNPLENEKTTLETWNFFVFIAESNVCSPLLFSLKALETWLLPIWLPPILQNIPCTWDPDRASSAHSHPELCHWSGSEPGVRGEVVSWGSHAHATSADESLAWGGPKWLQQVHGECTNIAFSLEDNQPTN